MESRCSRRAWSRGESALDLRIEIRRDLELGDYGFTEVFQGFDRVGAVKAIFGKRTKEALSGIKVVLASRRGYMHIDGQTGDLHISRPYLEKADARYIYLDIIHELVHIRQFHEGKELFDEKYDYVDRPTEIEAYRATLKEARRIGYGGEELVEYLRVDWVSEADFKRFLELLGVET
jgi:hypothetical protein